MLERRRERQCGNRPVCTIRTRCSPAALENPWFQKLNGARPRRARDLQRGCDQQGGSFINAIKKVLPQAAHFIPSTNTLPAAWCSSGSPLGYSPYLQDQAIIWVTNFFLVGSTPGNALRSVNKRAANVTHVLVWYMDPWRHRGDIYPSHPCWDSLLPSHKPRGDSNLSLPHFHRGLHVIARRRRGRGRR